MSTFKKDVNDISNTRKIITVKLPADLVAEEEASLIKNFQLQAKVPGFRPGRHLLKWCVRAMRKS